MRRILKRITFPLLARWYTQKTSGVQRYTKYGISLTIMPDVFHPGVFLSTNILIRFLAKQSLHGKRLLELGAGSGLISFYAQKNGAFVTATDINPQAIAGLKLNAEHNQLPIAVIETSLFNNLIINEFDLVIINPPYYPQEVQNMREAAFYCGPAFEYFTDLFQQLSVQQLQKSCVVFMILSEDCRISHIRELAAAQCIDFEEVYRTSKWGERNYIFQLSRNE
ncbi:MAG: methyltransferase [Bacteroidota bacterium]